MRPTAGRGLRWAERAHCNDDPFAAATRPASRPAPIANREPTTRYENSPPPPRPRPGSRATSRLSAQSGRTTCLSFSPTANLLVSASACGASAVRVWDVRLHSVRGTPAVAMQVWRRGKGMQSALRVLLSRVWGRGAQAASDMEAREALVKASAYLQHRCTFAMERLGWGWAIKGRGQE